jgi:hypothetical protein
MVMLEMDLGRSCIVGGALFAPGRRLAGSDGRGRSLGMLRV